MSGLTYGSEEGRSVIAVTHLALARSQSVGTGILGTKENSPKGLFSFELENEREANEKKNYHIMRIYISVGGNFCDWKQKSD